VVNTGYDLANRVSSVTGNLFGRGTNYVGNVQYAPHGSFSSFGYGNGLNTVFSYNQRLQPSLITGTPTGESNYLLQLALYWGDNATQNQNNNGNLRGQLIATNNGPTPGNAK
jgi:hypothetical protein